MMAKRATKDVIRELLAKYDANIKAAFLDAIDNIRSNITLQVVVDRLEANDINGAIEAMHLEPEAFSRLDSVITAAYHDGGHGLVNNLPTIRDPEGLRLILRFGIRSIEAEQFLSNHSSQLITEIDDDMRFAIRTSLAESLSQGVNPRVAALNVVGRINPVTGRREGGIIGLTSGQERAVAAARAELSSLDPSELRAYLDRARRDKRFDSTILNAIKTGKGLTQDAITKIVGRYSDKLLDLRGEMLARTETLTALGSSRDEAMRQQITAGKVQAQDVTKIWHSAGDNRVRDTHKELDGMQVGMDDSFQSPSGAMLRFPGDPDGPASEIIGCRCYLEYKVDYFARVVANYKAKRAA